MIEKVPYWGYLLLILSIIIVFGFIYHTFYYSNFFKTRELFGKKVIGGQPLQTDFYFSEQLTAYTKTKLASELKLVTSEDKQTPSRWTNFNAYHEFKIIKKSSNNLKFYNYDVISVTENVNPLYERSSLIDLVERKFRKSHFPRIISTETSYESFLDSFSSHMLSNLNSMIENKLCTEFSPSKIVNQLREELKVTYFNNYGKPVSNFENLRLRYFSLALERTFTKASTCKDKDQNEVLKFYFYRSALIYFGYSSETRNVGYVSLEEVQFIPSFTDFLYFSAVTSTTTGYGDIVPASNKARILSFIQTILTYIFLGLLLGKITKHL